MTRVCPDRHSWRHPSLKSLCSRLVLLRFTLLSDRSVRAGKSRALCRVGVLVRQWCDFLNVSVSRSFSLSVRIEYPVLESCDKGVS